MGELSDLLCRAAEVNVIVRNEKLRVKNENLVHSLNQSLSRSVAGDAEAEQPEKHRRKKSLGTSKSPGFSSPARSELLFDGLTEHPLEALECLSRNQRKDGLLGCQF